MTPDSAGMRLSADSDSFTRWSGDSDSYEHAACKTAAIFYTL